MKQIPESWKIEWNEDLEEARDYISSVYRQVHKVYKKTYGIDLDEKKIDTLSSLTCWIDEACEEIEDL